MSVSNAHRIRTANQALLVDGEDDAVDRFFTPGYVAHGTDGVLTEGPSGVRRFLRALRGAFTDLSVEVEILVEGEDRIGWCRTVRATHTGEFGTGPNLGIVLIKLID